MKTMRVFLLTLLALLILYMFWTMARPPVRAQADVDQKTVKGFAVTSTDVFA
jgi:hypothetical protein